MSKFKTAATRLSLASLAAALSLVAVAATPSAGDTDDPGSDACTPLKQLAVTYLSPSGQVIPAQVAGGGEIDVYQTLEGDPVGSLVLPEGLDLSKSSSDVISGLGLPPRPADGTEQQVWDDAFGGPASPGGPTTPCETQTSNNTSPFWAGRLDTNHTYTSVQGQFTIPTFSAACPHASAHSIWAGIGGWVESSPGLIQAGIGTSQSSVNSVYPFYEVYPLQAEVTPGYPPVSVGDVVSVVVVYDAGTAYFTIRNLTTGAQRTYPEHGVSGYYDSRYAEWIDERPSHAHLAHPVDGNRYYYRKSTQTHWIGMKANGQDAGHWTTVGVNMKRTNGNVLSTATLVTIASDNHTWKSCS